AWLAMRPALALPAAGAVVSLTVLMVAVFCPHVLGPAFEAARQRPTQDAQQIVAVPLRSSTPQADLARQNGWIDAGKAALKQGAVRVQVVAVSVAVVPFRGARPTFSKEKHLIVRLLIQHAGSGGPFDYAHWGV